MKNIRLLSLVMSLVMAAAMMFAFTGCGGSGDPQPEPAPEPTEATTAGSLLDDPEYDINIVLDRAGLWDALDASGVDYRVDQISNTANAVGINTGSQELDGVAGTFMAFAKGDTEYENFPDYQILGEKDGVVYILLLPTDVRYDYNDPQQIEEYEHLTELIKAFVMG